MATPESSPLTPEEKQAFAEITNSEFGENNPELEHANRIVAEIENLYELALRKNFINERTHLYRKNRAVPLTLNTAFHTNLSTNMIEAIPDTNLLVIFGNTGSEPRTATVLLYKTIDKDQSECLGGMALKYDATKGKAIDYDPDSEGAGPKDWLDLLTATRQMFDKTKPKPQETNIS